MRLTLRTMLCYLDDVLEPADAKELGAKIEESEYASNMVHRIRTSMRRQRLGAPRLTGEGAADPNTVASYLDNTLPPDQVPDFERVCLDPGAEAQLAEVAACHQVLTLVLGEPADVPPEMRQRMYRFGQGDMTARGATAAKSPAAASAAATDGAAASATGASALMAATGAAVAQQQPHSDSPELAKRTKPEVPDYLKHRVSGSRWPLVLTLVLLALLAGGAVLTIWGPGRRLAGGPNANRPGDNKDSLFNVDAGPKGRNGGGTIAGANGKNSAKPPVEGTQGNSTNTSTGDDDGANDGDIETTGSGDPASAASGTGDSSDDDLTAPPIAPAAVDASGAGGDAVAKVDPPMPGHTPPGETPPLPPADKIVGHYMSAGQVLAVFDAKEHTWHRVAPRAALKPGMELRTLPTYRPQMLLENDLQITFSGDGALTIVNPAADDAPAVDFPFGRLIVATMGKAGNKLAIRIGDRDVLLTMVNADAALAIEAARFHAPGDDPQADLAHLQVTATVTGGQVQWQEGAAPPVTLDAGQAISILDEGVPSVANGVAAPKWVKSSDIAAIDVLASGDAEQQMSEDRALELTLEELAESQRVELRSLAVRGLAALDQFDRIVDSFSNDKLKSYWASHFDYLRQATARNQATAVREAFTRRKGDEGEKLYRVLRGYSQQQLTAGDGKQLVEQLKSPSLDTRVLAFNALERITKATHGFRPERPEQSRVALREWEATLAGDGIIYKNPPPDLPKRAAKTP